MKNKNSIQEGAQPASSGGVITERSRWVACHDTLVCAGAKQIQKWCVREGDAKGPLVAVMLTKEVAHALAASPEMFNALRECLALIDDMSRFIGVMSLQNYQRFNEAPIAARVAISKATGTTSTGQG